MFKDDDIVCIFLRNRVFRFGQKIIHWRAGAIFIVYAWKKMFIIRQPVKFFTKNDNSVKFSQKTTILWRNLWSYCEIFYLKCGIIFTRFHAFIWWRKNRYVKFFSCVHPLIGLFKKHFTKINFLSSVPPLI